MYGEYYVSLCCYDEVELYFNKKTKSEVGICQSCKKFCSYEEDEEHREYESPYSDEPADM